MSAGNSADRARDRRRFGREDRVDGGAGAPEPSPPAAGSDRGDGGRPSRRRSVERARGVYMISVAAELAGMHPQTLRIYEARGLITPKRSPKNTRLYSQEDVERLQRIQELTTELGMNLAGVEKVFELEGELDRMRRRVAALEREAERLQEELTSEVERVRRSVRRELVRYEPAGRALVPARDTGRSRRPVSAPER